MVFKEIPYSNLIHMQRFITKLEAACDSFIFQHIVSIFDFKFIGRSINFVCLFKKSNCNILSHKSWLAFYGIMNPIWGAVAVFGI